jgi:hypothetical protein
VLAPVLVSATMIAAGVWHLRTPVRIPLAQWCGILIGALVIIVAFAMDYRNIMASGMPRDFNWGVFGAGLGTGVGSYVNAVRSRQAAGSMVGIAR